MTPDPARMADLQAWLRRLDDAVLVGWANRGLLRRARGIVDGAVGSGDGHATGLRCSIESQTVVLAGPGFQHLHCSCPASGPCHHALAALLHWSGQACDAPTATTADPATARADTPFWNQADWAPLARAWRTPTLRRARGWLEDGLQPRFVASAERLDAHLHDQDDTRVRFDAAPGPAGALCTCAQPACAHAAAALCAWRQQQGLDSGDATPLRSRRESAVLDDAETALRTIADEGIAQLSATRLDALDALAQRCRQADLPALARDLVDLHRAASAELARRRHADVAAVARTLARAWARLRALQAPVAPQPRSELKGRHRRDYRPAPPLDLDICAIERWDANGVNGTGIGHTLHAWCHAGRRWWRLPVADVSGAGGAMQDWRPQRWGGRSLGDLLGQRLRLDGAWASDDGSLSARADTRWSSPDLDAAADGAHPERPAPADALLEIAAAISAWRSERPPGLLDARPRIALLGGLHLLPGTDANTLRARDASGRTLTLHWPGDSDSRLRARHRFDVLRACVTGPHHVLGWLQCIDGGARLEPINLWCATTQQWWHLHAADQPDPQPPAGSRAIAVDRAPATQAARDVAPRTDALLRALLATRALACRLLAHGCAHAADPGITLALARWRTQGFGRDWPGLLHGVGAQAGDEAPAFALLDALARIELALQAHDPG
jgi:hypothetical protein